MICFLPLALVGVVRSRTSLREAVRLYYICIFIFLVFFLALALYTYWQGGNFIKPMGTFY